MAAQLDGRGLEAEHYSTARQAALPTRPTALDPGLLLEDQRRWAEAEAVCRDALKIEPSDPAIQRHMAVLLRRLGRYRQPSPGDWASAVAAVRLAAGQPA